MLTGFDSSIMPATGTPEPGGLMWEDVLPIIKEVCKTSNIIGADINELAPIKNFDSYNFLVAKLTYKILSYIFKFKLLGARSLIFQCIITEAPPSFWS